MLIRLKQTAQRLHPLLGQLLRFGLVGGLATLVHLGVAWLSLLTWPAANPFVINLIAFLVAFQVSFWGHARFTFRQQGSAWRFMGVTLGGFTLNNALLWLFLTLGIQSPFLAICLAVFFVPLFVFTASRLWVFKT